MGNRFGYWSDVILTINRKNDNGVKQRIMIFKNLKAGSSIEDVEFSWNFFF